SELQNRSAFLQRAPGTVVVIAETPRRTHRRKEHHAQSDRQEDDRLPARGGCGGTRRRGYRARDERRRTGRYAGREAHLPRHRGVEYVEDERAGWRRRQEAARWRDRREEARPRRVRAGRGRR